MSVKTFYERDMGNRRGRYHVNVHDGVQTHKDGSEFFGLNIFSNKRKKNKFVKELLATGHIERVFSIIGTT